MATIYTKELNGITFNIDDAVVADEMELYANESRTQYTIEAFGSASYINFFGTAIVIPMADPYFHRDGGNTISPDGSWVKALYFDTRDNYLCLKIAGNNSFNGLVTTDITNYLPTVGDWYSDDSHDKVCAFATNLPIFETAEEAFAYCNEESELGRQQMIKSLAVNFKKEEFEEDTKYFYISNLRGEANCVRNTATSTGAQTWRSIRFSANTRPVLYFNEDYSLSLKAPNVVASYSMAAPAYIIDNVPESSWQDGLAYTGLWYGNIMSRLEARGETLPDGEYMYGFDLTTNITIHKDEAAADHALETGDYSDAINPGVIGGGGYNPPEFGDDEQDTEFGGGADTSPFMQTYVLSRNALIQVAQAWYNTNPSTMADIITGLKMFGDIPQECLAGVTMYPFDVTRILNTATQQYIYFGTYQLELGTPISKAMSLASNAYLDCGTVFLAALQHNYKDYEPFTVIDLYLPYIGWQRMDISLLINKYVSIRYYVDIHTRACCAVVLVRTPGTTGNVIVGEFSGTIGVGLPICSADYQGYANSMASTMLNGVNSVMGSAKGGYNSAMGMLGNIAAGSGLGLSIAGGVGGVALNMGAAALHTASTLNQLEQLGAPADHPIMRGGFTSCIGTYMPQQVIWRYTIHDTVEPDNFNELCGRPSSASGRVGDFSGFLSVKSVDLNTNGMLDHEAAEVYSALKSGVFI